MRKPFIVASVLAWVLVCATQSSVAATVPAPRKTLTAFANDREFFVTLKRLSTRLRQETRARRLGAASESTALAASAPAASQLESESVTNVQQAGVDEGGIVKVHGEHLVVLRRGRLFTVRIGDGDLRPVAAVDAFGPDVDPSSSWYDEMLISGNTLVVIGFSYQRGGTELGLFNIAADGRLAYRGTYHLRSNDYYSSRNYASRLIGDQLILYAPLYLNLYVDDVVGQLPALRKWGRSAGPADFKRIAPATRIYRTDAELDVEAGIALHNVTTCNLAKPELECRSTALLGPPGHVFYVSPSSVYVWATQWRLRGPLGEGKYSQESSVFRLPLDGSAPSTLKVAGSPIDQFSFLEGAGHLNVLVRADGNGDGMWAAEVNAGDLALLRVPLGSFSDGQDAAPSGAYQRLPKPEGDALQSRYVGPYLLYGGGNGWYAPQSKPESAVYALRYAEQSGVFAVGLQHGVDRIEALGNNAVVIGSDGKDLHFTSLRLSRYPAAAGKYVRANAAQGETRSHGFFYKAESNQLGLLGLPIISANQPAARQLQDSAAGVLYVRNRNLDFSEVGALAARPLTERDDGCRASCIDWYGNARPLFLRGRVFALLGYEIVEGALQENRIKEIRRIDLAERDRVYSRY